LTDWGNIGQVILSEAFMVVVESENVNAKCGVILVRNSALVRTFLGLVQETIRIDLFELPSSTHAFCLLLFSFKSLQSAGQTTNCMNKTLDGRSWASIGGPKTTGTAIALRGYSKTS
jgi:hypothetical protein